MTRPDEIDERQLERAIGQFIVIGLGLAVLAAAEGNTRFTTITAAHLVVLRVSAALTPPVVTPATTWSPGGVVLPGFVLVVGGLVGSRRDPPPDGGT